MDMGETRECSADESGLIWASCVHVAMTPRLSIYADNMTPALFIGRPADDHVCNAAKLDNQKTKPLQKTFVPDGETQYILPPKGPREVTAI